MTATARSDNDLAMATQFILGAKATGSDGLCGEVVRAILDPATKTVRYLVIEPRHRMADGRLVPVELVEAGAGEIRLRCSVAEFDRLAPAEEIEVVQGLDYPGGIGMGMDLGYQTPIITSDVVPEGESEVAHHERVHASDGEIGRLKGFAVDPADHRVTHVLLREGHLWGRKDVAIPVSAVTSVDNGIWLQLTKKQVEALPARD
jgi:hypothetical protein